MNNRKNNNSVVFIAALGVYLGLVLVGATPQVMAQAAMTRQFNVKDEVEVKDDFDNKPDGTTVDCALGLSPNVANQLVKLYSTAVLRYLKKGAVFEETETLYGHSRSNLPIVENLLNDGYDSIFATVCLDLHTKLTDVALSSDEFNITIEVISRTSAFDRNAFFYPFANVIDMKRKSPPGDPRNAQVIRNTSLFMQNDQIFITTRLPRAGLDSLLATDAK